MSLKKLRHPFIATFIFVILMVALLSIPAIFLNFKPQYHEQVEIRVELESPASFVLEMPFILMNKKLTPSFVELDLQDDDRFSGNEDVLLDAEEINGSLFFKFLGFGQKLNLSSTFASSPLSSQNYSELMTLHEFTTSETYNQTHLQVPIFFNSTLDNPEVRLIRLSLLFTFSFESCTNGLSDPIDLILSHGWNKYYVPKSLFQTTCK